MLSFIPGSRDLASILSESDEVARGAAVHAAMQLLRAMTEARVVHPDLNLRNVLVTHGETGATAWVVDVDRVIMDHGTPAAALRANMRRFSRSFHKLLKRGEIQASRSDGGSFLSTRATRA
jgi:hypothetical protein